MSDFIPGEEFLRRAPVDITKYLPEFLVKDQEFKATCSAESLEHERIRQLLPDIFNQFFVDTATWGLDMWERILDIHPASGATYEYRRAQIKVHMKAVQVSTLEVMTAIVNAYGSGWIEENSNLYYFNIYASCNDKAALTAMKTDILTYKPAHLGINIYLGYSWNGVKNFDGSITYDTHNEDWSEI